MLTSTRTTNLLLVAVLAVGVGLVAMLATGVLAGPLDPPLAPGSTDGVREPGTPISALPFTISSAGRYYVTRDLVGSTGITIQADNVTLDLGGFEVRGTAPSGNGIFVNGFRRAVRIRNGIVRGWFNGIDAGTATNAMMSDLQVIGNGGVSFDGSIGVVVNGWSTLEHCIVSGNKATGIRAFNSVVRDCEVTDNGNDGLVVVGGSLVQDTLFRSNSSAGGGWFDVRVQADNTLSENMLGHVAIDTTTGLAVSVGMRNGICSLSALGPSGNFSYFPVDTAAGDSNHSTC